MLGKDLGDLLSIKAVDPIMKENICLCHYLNLLFTSKIKKSKDKVFFKKTLHWISVLCMSTLCL